MTGKVPQTVAKSPRRIIGTTTGKNISVRSESKISKTTTTSADARSSKKARSRKQTQRHMSSTDGLEALMKAATFVHPRDQPLDSNFDDELLEPNLYNPYEEPSSSRTPKLSLSMSMPVLGDYTGPYRPKSKPVVEIPTSSRNDAEVRQRTFDEPATTSGNEVPCAPADSSTPSKASATSSTQTSSVLPSTVNRNRTTTSLADATLQSIPSLLQRLASRIRIAEESFFADNDYHLLVAEVNRMNELTELARMQKSRTVSLVCRLQARLAEQEQAVQQLKFRHETAIARLRARGAVLDASVETAAHPLRNAPHLRMPADAPCIPPLMPLST